MSLHTEGVAHAVSNGRCWGRLPRTSGDSALCAARALPQRVRGQVKLPELRASGILGRLLTFLKKQVMGVLALIRDVDIIRRLISGMGAHWVAAQRRRVASMEARRIHGSNPTDLLQVWSHRHQQYSLSTHAVPRAPPPRHGVAGYRRGGPSALGSHSPSSSSPVMVALTNRGANWWDGLGWIGLSAPPPSLSGQNSDGGQ